jgi:predicted Zn-dependent peptidase
MYLDDPGHRLYEQAMAEHFGNHPLSISILGSPASIMKLTRDQMANYFASRYGPGNMVLAVTGKVDFNQFVKLAEKYCGNWPDAPRSPIRSTSRSACRWSTRSSTANTRWR